jgi:putative transcriptional regulator
MTISSWREAFARQGRVQVIDRVPSGSPASFLLVLDRTKPLKSVLVAIELVRRGLPMPRAKRVIDELVDTGQVYVHVPVVEDVAAFRDLMHTLHVTATVIDPSAPVDARAIREALGLTQEQFALRFGLELDALRNWETGRREPDTAAKSYLRVIAKEPARVQLALVGA